MVYGAKQVVLKKGDDMTNQSFYLDLIPKGVPPVIRVSQNDEGQTWLISLLFNKSPFTIPAGAAVYVQGTKPNGATFKEACTFSGNVVTATESQDMTDICGNVRAEIVIEKDDETIHSLNFIVSVEQTA